MVLYSCKIYIFLIYSFKTIASKAYQFNMEKG